MSKKTLVINCGSSSLKYQLLDMSSERVVAKGLIQRIGEHDGMLVQKNEACHDQYEVHEAIHSHSDACELMLQALSDDNHGAIKSFSEIGVIGHRVLHGGEEFSEPVLINEHVITAIRKNIPLGPLHNPANLMGIEACKKIMPDIPMVAVFDTAFHQTMPPKAFMYGVPYTYYKKLHVRKYGFHGTSHQYVSQRAAQLLGKDISELRIITCHLGNGSSVCAVEHGTCIDTSMGITPLEGVIMGTRSGSLDPAVLQYIMNNDKDECGHPRIGSIDEMLNILNYKSGLFGISGYSDMRDVAEHAAAGEKRAMLAREMLIYGIKKYIGAYTASMNGVDAIVFTAGIGENDIALRREIMNGFEYIGAVLDEKKNEVKGVETVISSDSSKVKILLIPTNEELAIAREAMRIAANR